MFYFGVSPRERKVRPELICKAQFLQQIGRQRPPRRLYMTIAKGQKIDPSMQLSRTRILRVSKLETC